MKNELKIRRDIHLVKKDIGISLRYLKSMKRYPDNHSPSFYKVTIENLSSSIRALNKFKKEYPLYFNPRVKQTKLRIF